MKATSRGFTLIELMVVISIIGLLSSIMMASLKGARDKANISAGLQYEGFVQRTRGDRAIVFWNFNEGTGPTVNDKSGFNNTPSPIATPKVWWSTDGPASGKGGSVALDGSSGAHMFKALPASQATLSTRGFTFMAWIKPTTNTTGAIMGRYLTHMARNASGSVSFQIFCSPLTCESVAGWSKTTTTGVTPINQWTHVAGVYTADGRLQIHINGKRLVDYVNPNPSNIAPFVAESGFTVGAVEYPVSTFGTYFNGKIDEAIFINDGLSVAEIEQYYAETKGDFLAHH